MEFLKDFFEKAENKTLTFEQFTDACSKANIKLANLSNGDYVSKSKYLDDIKAKDNQIDTLNGTISTRDTDLATIKKQLEDAGVDAQKLSTLSTDLSTLQGKYDNDIKQYQDQLAKQAYEFAVKEFASTKKFTSNAAKRDFINSMISENLKIKDDKIMGADDFVTSYTTENSDAFVVEDVKEKEPTASLPSFVQPTSSSDTSTGSDLGGFKFNFTGVRKRD
jgi:hypothetical protein